jgi:hypothetical protein
MTIDFSHAESSVTNIIKYVTFEPNLVQINKQNSKNKRIERKYNGKKIR